jgi:hypothetical protein
MNAPIDPTPETSASPGYALLIGINHYDNLDPSAELPGSRNDVLMWYRFCRDHLGIPAENIRALTSPPLDPKKDFGDAAVPPETLGDAAEASIRDGYAWLLAKMDGGKSPGLLTYSGHGMVVDGRPALSTASLGGNGAGAILLSDLRDAVSKAKAEQALTAIFDCCHVVAPAAQSHLRRSTALVAAGQTAPEIVDEAFNVSHRVLLAARPGQAAYQCNLGERFHGALSFALVTTAEQWKATNAPGQTGLDVDYRDLFKRARKLLRALRMKQSPKLRVPFDPESRRLVRRLPFFGTEARATTRKPDAPRVKQQLPPDWLITIRQDSNDGAILAQIVTMGDTQTRVVVSQQGNSHSPMPWPATSEIWYANTLAIGALSSSTAKIVVTSEQLKVDDSGSWVVTLGANTTFAFGGPLVGVRGDNFGIGTYSSIESATWTPGSPTPFTSTSYYFTAPPAATADYSMVMQIVVPSPGSTSLVAVQWYKLYPTAPSAPPTDIQPGSTTGIGYASSAAPPISDRLYSAVSFLKAQ